ncbi:MAG: methionyl-tRNA formyltransferase [Chloroflexota bacterium]
MTQNILQVALLSSTQFGHMCLEEGVLPLKEVQVVGILTTPRLIDISYSQKPVEIKTHADFTQLGIRAQCPVVTMTGKMSASNYLQHLEVWKPDLILVLGWYYLIPARVREIARIGCAGIHASLLPKYRGGAPIPWAIINGETETGVTFFYFDDGVDSGDIIAQERFPIEHCDTCATVYDKASQASITILRENLKKMAVGAAPRIPQDESQATSFPQRKPEDGLIDWAWDAKRIRDFIRAQTKPYPGAFTFIEGKKVTIWDADVIDPEHEYEQ